MKIGFIENSITTLIKFDRNNDCDSTMKSTIADIILLLDSTNEDGLSIKIKALAEIQNYSQAKKVYNNFQKEYYRLFAEEYSKSFDEIVN